MLIGWAVVKNKYWILIGWGRCWRWCAASSASSPWPSSSSSISPSRSVFSNPKSSVPDPWYFGVDPCLFKTTAKNWFSKEGFSVYYFLKVHLLTSFSKKLQNSRNQCFSYYLCLLIEGSGPFLWLMDPDSDPGVPKTCRSGGSGSEHCRKVVFKVTLSNPKRRLQGQFKSKKTSSSWLHSCANFACYEVIKSIVIRNKQKGTLR